MYDDWEDFVVPSGQQWVITALQIRGSYGGTGSNATTANVLVYASCSGSPCGTPGQFNNQPFTGGPNDFTVTFSPPITTNVSGTLWVAGAAEPRQRVGQPPMVLDEPNNLVQLRRGLGKPGQRLRYGVHRLDSTFRELSVRPRRAGSGLPRSRECCRASASASAAASAATSPTTATSAALSASSAPSHSRARQLETGLRTATSDSSFG